MASFETIVYEEIEAGVGMITLNRPERLNAMSGDFREAIQAFSEKRPPAFAVS